MSNTEMKNEIYKDITEKMIKALEAGTAPWCKPWRMKAGEFDPSQPHNAATGTPYHGTNVMVCWLSGYSSQQWMTFNQCSALGGKVRKGEKATKIIHWKMMVKQDPKDSSKQIVIPLLKTFNIFNIAQLEDIEQDKLKKPTPMVIPEDGFMELANSHGAVVKHGGDSAYFTPMFDHIQMPNAASFKTREDYESTLAHELVHWTGHKSRLDRKSDGNEFKHSYAFEELVAEMGSAFLLARFGIGLDGLQHQEYIGSWIKALQNDHSIIFKAAKYAEEAAAYLMNETMEEEDKEAA